MAGELQQLAAQQLWRKQVAARLGGVSLSTSAQTGFTFIPTMQGVPTGVPTPAQPGMAAMVVDATNYRLYFFAGGAWRNAGP